MSNKYRPDSIGSSGLPELPHPGALSRRSTQKKPTPPPPGIFSERVSRDPFPVVPHVGKSLPKPSDIAKTKPKKKQEPVVNPSPQENKVIDDKNTSDVETKEFTQPDKVTVPNEDFPVIPVPPVVETVNEEKTEEPVVDDYPNIAKDKSDVKLGLSDLVQEVDTDSVERILPSELETREFVPIVVPEPFTDPVPEPEPVTDTVPEPEPEPVTDTVITTVPEQEETNKDTDNVTGEEKPEPVKKALPQSIYGREIKPSGTTQVSVKKPKVFWATMACWTAAIVASSSLLGGWGYTMWLEAEATKKANIAYEEGARDIISDPEFESVIRISDSDFDTIISQYPGNDLPEGYRITDKELIGWSIPGGTEYNGRADVEMCWTALDIEGEKKSRVYLVSENAQDESPTWLIDAMTNTGESCSSEKPEN